MTSFSFISSLSTHTHIYERRKDSKRLGIRRFGIRKHDISWHHLNNNNNNNNEYTHDLKSQKNGEGCNYL